MKTNYGLKIILFVSLLPLLCLAQNDTLLKRQKFYCGINGGFNFSKISSDTINFSYGTKPTIGLFWRYNIFKNIFIKNSALYSIKGSTSDLHYIKFKNTYLCKKIKANLFSIQILWNVWMMNPLPARFSNHSPGLTRDIFPNGLTAQKQTQQKQNASPSL